MNEVSTKAAVAASLAQHLVRVLAPLALEVAGMAAEAELLRALPENCDLDEAARTARAISRAAQVAEDDGCAHALDVHAAGIPVFSNVAAARTELYAAARCTVANAADAAAATAALAGDYVHHTAAVEKSARRAIKHAAWAMRASLHVALATARSAPESVQSTLPPCHPDHRAHPARKHDVQRRFYTTSRDTIRTRVPDGTPGLEIGRWYPSLENDDTGAIQATAA